MPIMYIDINTMQEKPGKFVKMVSPFKGQIMTEDGKKLVLDIDDFWSV